MSADGPSSPWGLFAPRHSRAALRAAANRALRALVVEDTAALIGVTLAAAGLFLHQVLGWTEAEAGPTSYLQEN